MEEMKTEYDEDIVCSCGNKDFYILEKMIPEHECMLGKYTGIILTFELICTKCKGELSYSMTIINHKNNEINVERKKKECSKCKNKRFHAHIKEESKGFCERTVFTYTLSCADPKCTWKNQCMLISDFGNQPTDK